MNTTIPNLKALNKLTNPIQIGGNIRHFAEVKEGVKLANDLLKNRSFYEQIAALPWLDGANVAPGVIASLMGNAGITMSVVLYYAMNSMENIDGYDDTENPSFIHLNIWKIHRSPASICNTIIHSCVHATNACHPDCFFGHGDGTLKEEKNTAPYAIGALAQQMVSDGSPMFIPLEHDPYEMKLMRKLPRESTSLGPDLAHANCFFPIVN